MGTYDTMWEGLGLDLRRHESLMGILGEFYPMLYLSQKDRPKGMEYFDFVVSEIHGLRVKELLEHKKKGGKVVGTFCVYVPDEILMAAGAIGVGLCGGAEFSIPDAEKTLPRDLCPLIKSVYGFKDAKICPYLQACDMLVGETTCDGKKKVWELLKQELDVHVMEVPQKKVEPEARALWRAEVRKLLKRMEELSGRRITNEKLAEALSLTNGKRKALDRLYMARRADPAPISGKDALLVSQIAFYDDVRRFTEKTNALAAEAEERGEKGKGVLAGSKRVLVTGTPMAIPNWKLHHVIETSGAVVAAEETCTGARYFHNPEVKPGRTLGETLDRIADRYLETPCACFTPNDRRIENVVSMAREWNAAGVVQYVLKFCQIYSIEGILVEKALKKAGIPVITVETDYGMGDMEQLSTRMAAFVEMI